MGYYRLLYVRIIFWGVIALLFLVSRYLFKNKDIKWYWFLVIFILFLLFPKVIRYKDGGTTVYWSPVYQVISWNTLNGKTDTEYYFFPDNFKDHMNDPESDDVFLEERITCTIPAGKTSEEVLKDKLREYYGENAEFFEISKVDGEFEYFDCVFCYRGVRTCMDIEAISDRKQMDLKNHTNGASPKKAKERIDSFLAENESRLPQLLQEAYNNYHTSEMYEYEQYVYYSATPQDYTFNLAFKFKARDAKGTYYSDCYMDGVMLP